ncbi:MULTISPECIES: alkene reductase [Paraburkholderia]|uniref:alkene reductase n=1 Tax=Paraburkholderia TaxID=1822464 RepID=UPI002259A3C8|nr:MULTISPECIES: alkene reductase [Paraburkholderia]MCX4170832.1 alkene reductase [Paraburkholderia madseniana]MDQ6458844.1 alkene reductase [Paraburkholderia madseniana]
MSPLLNSYDMGGIRLANRVVMAPMTRCRARSTVPDTQTVLYYRQRAGAGLILSEGAQISAEGTGYLYTPGIYTPEQVDGWKQVTKAVHEEGGKMFVQLWHVGRMSHVSLQKGGARPVSSVAVVAQNSNCYAYGENGEPGPIQASEPRALETSEIARITSDFVTAGVQAMRAGFDGVEIHGANGYIFDQFANGALNTRTDQYGGSTMSRLRFTLETVDALATEIGNSRVGIRLSPFGRLYDMQPFDDEENTWLTLANELSKRNLAYVHLSDQTAFTGAGIAREFLGKFRDAYDGTLILTGALDQDAGEELVELGLTDLAGYGRPFVSNPDLVERFRNGWPLSPIDMPTLYTGGEKGYADYPAYSEQLESTSSDLD